MAWSKFLLSLALLIGVCGAQTPSSKEVESVYSDAHALYLDVHEHPELSAHETQTAAKLAERWRAAGYEVSEHVGGTGVVAILKNGSGPTILLRTELDALPVEEKTGLPYASKVRAKDDAGHDVPVMHACGHDLHMAAILGTAEIMAHSKNSWHGTLILIGQPAEETIAGAEGMVKDGLFTRFPRPDVVLALHVGNELPAGKVGVIAGVYDTNADSLRITIFGKGGHGSAPNTTVDPIVIAARTILALQTIPKELYEAARVDGARRVASFFVVTVPGLRPATLLVVITSVITGANFFTEPYLLTGGGGPDNQSISPVFLMYRQGIEQNHPGYASAIGLLLVVGVRYGPVSSSVIVFTFQPPRTPSTTREEFIHCRPLPNGSSYVPVTSTR